MHQLLKIHCLNQQSGSSLQGSPQISVYSSRHFIYPKQTFLNKCEFDSSSLKGITTGGTILFSILCSIHKLCGSHKESQAACPLGIPRCNNTYYSNVFYSWRRESAGDRIWPSLHLMSIFGSMSDTVADITLKIIQ